MPQLPYPPTQGNSQQQMTPPPQGQPGVSQVMKGMQSFLNPTDVVAMIKAGEITKDTTFAEIFARMGIDVNGSIMQIADKLPQQMQKADPLQKMKAIGNAQPEQMPPMPAQQMPPQGGGLEDLMQGY